MAQGSQGPRIYQFSAQQVRPTSRRKPGEIHWAGYGWNLDGSEPRRRALDYLKGLISPVERKNGWQLAEQARDATPDGVQRLLYNYVWDADLVRDDLGDYVVEHLGDANGVLVVDETGFLKKGTKSAGVQRQYSGTAGRIENCQIGVFLTYATGQGKVLMDRELYLPQVWSEDWERRREEGAPEGARFQTKPHLARKMVAGAVESGVPFRWFAGDTVYGSDRRLRRWLEQQEIPHVLAIKSNEKLWAWTEAGPRQVRADRLASQVEETGWARLSAGDGSKGPRIYDWTWVAIPPLREPGKGYWLLVRRSIAEPEELAYYVCYGPGVTPLEELVRVAGIESPRGLGIKLSAVAFAVAIMVTGIGCSIVPKVRDIPLEFPTISAPLPTIVIVRQATPTPSPSEIPSTPEEGPTSVASPVTPTGPGTSDVLANLVLAPVPPVLPEYDRKGWRHWGDSDKDCQDTRQEVLVAESLDAVEFTDEKECRVAAGRWEALYSNIIVAEPRRLEVDYVVPLANAHRSGAYRWSAERKGEYANFLEEEAHLIPVTAGANRSKGTRGPEVAGKGLLVPVRHGLGQH